MQSERIDTITALAKLGFDEAQMYDDDRKDIEFYVEQLGPPYNPRILFMAKGKLGDNEALVCQYKDQDPDSTDIYSLCWIPQDHILLRWLPPATDRRDVEVIFGVEKKQIGERVKSDVVTVSNILYLFKSAEGVPVQAFFCSPDHTRYGIRKARDFTDFDYDLETGKLIRCSVNGHPTITESLINPIGKGYCGRMEYADLRTLGWDFDTISTPVHLELVTNLRDRVSGPVLAPAKLHEDELEILGFVTSSDLLTFLAKQSIADDVGKMVGLAARFDYAAMRQTI